TPSRWRRRCRQRRLRALRDLEDQLLGLIAERQFHAIGRHGGDVHTVDFVALPHDARLASRNLLQERDLALSGYRGPHELEPARVEPVRPAVYGEHWGGTPRRVEQRSRNHLGVRRKPSLDLILGQRHRRHRSRLDRGRGGRHAHELTAPVDLPADERGQCPRWNEPQRPPARATPVDRERQGAHFLASPFLEPSANAKLETSSRTESSGSLPGGGLKPRNAFSGRTVMFSISVYGVCVSSA